jgi:hypothetical protein
LAWKATPILILALVVASLLIAVLQPLVLLCLSGADAGRRAKSRRYALLSVFVIACLSARIAGLSLAGHAWNVAANLAAVACLGWLTLFAFSMRPSHFAIPVGALASLAVLLLFIFSMMFAVGDDGTTVRLSSDLYCNRTDDSTRIFRRHLFIDHQIYLQDETEPSADPGAIPPHDLPNAPAQCKALLQAAWRNASH